MTASYNDLYDSLSKVVEAILLLEAKNYLDIEGSSHSKFTFNEHYSNYIQNKNSDNYNRAMAFARSSGYQNYSDCIGSIFTS